MKATEAKFLDFLKKSPQFVIPIYQRTYSWTEKECQQLWDDIIRAGRNEAVLAHFVGSIVYIEKGLYQVMSQSQLLVIDGQQRLTTVMLLIAALSRMLGDQEPVDGFSARKLRNYYLLNPEEEGERRFKLLLSQTDKASLTAVVSETELPNEQSVRVIKNFALFESLLASHDHDLVAVCRGLAKLIVVDVALSRDQDNPQLIFESMNSTGRELSQADLIRNYVLMGLEPELQTRLYEKFWRLMEVDFGQEAYSIQFDAFMRHYLTLKTGEIPRQDEVYEAFKAYARSATVAASGVEKLVKDIRDYARYYHIIALGAESNADLKMAFQDLRDLKVDVAYPFLLELYADREQGHLSTVDLHSMVRLVESYVFRRAVCGMPTNSLNKTFATFTKALKKDRYLESVQVHVLGLPSYRRFPTNDEFERALKARDLYNFGTRRTYWLRRLENYGRKERVSVDEYTIEHILPQNANLSPEWQKALGPDWQRIQQTWLHTLGNLTLTGYNSEYSDRPFPDKRDMVDTGLKFSPLKLNAGMGEVEIWNEKAIALRAEKLANKAVEVWPMPSVPADVIAAYRPNGSNVATYTISDHPNLMTGNMRPVYEALRKEILALDPCITEEFLKLYIAYKAETNFVDIVPQAKRLRLSLNMPFAELDDPKSVCKNVSNLGRWGNGDVELGVVSVDQIPYVIGLIRQSFERQMGNDA
jgi:uncharacterized protein with ParB-like and HNH nuclease domain/predicted transport protein